MFTLLCLTPLVNLRLWFSIKMPKLKREEAGSISKSERQKLQSLYIHGGAAYRSVRILVKASSLSVSKVRHFLHSKPSYTKFTLATRKFKRMKAFARYKNEIWCMDLAYVDKVAKDNNGVKSLLVRQDLFDRTVDSKEMKTKDSKETVRAFLTLITRKNRPKKIGLTREQNLLQSSKTMQSWRKKTLLYNEWDQGCICWTYNTIPEIYTLPLHGTQWIQVHSQIDSNHHNLDFQKKLFDRLDTEKYQTVRIFVHSVKQATTRVQKKSSLKLETDFASQSTADPSGKNISHNILGKFLKLLRFLPENLQHTQKKMNKMRLSAVNFIRKSWWKSSSNGIAYNRVGCKCMCATISRQYTELFYRNFTRATQSGRSMGCCSFGKFLPINASMYQNVTVEKFLFFWWKKNIQSRPRLNSTIWKPVSTLPIRILLKLWTLSFKKDTITAKTVSQLKCLEERKNLRFTLQLKDLILHSLIQIWATFSEVMFLLNLE